MKLAFSMGLNGMTRERFEACKAAGIEAIEVSVGDINIVEAIDFQTIKSLADEYGIKLWSFHLPFGPFEAIDISLPSLADYTLKRFFELIDKASAIGIKTFVVHPSGEPIAECDRPMRIECAKKSLFTLAEYAKSKDAIIAVEDLPRTCLGRNSSDVLELVSAHPDLRVCFDTNHLLGEDIGEFIEKVGSKIVTTHISDYDFINERHWLPGEGKIDWLSLKNELINVGYDGYWLYETGLGGSSWTIERERNLTPDDLSRNFNEIMSDVIPTPVGKAKENLPMFRN